MTLNEQLVTAELVRRLGGEVKVSLVDLGNIQNNYDRLDIGKPNQKGEFVLKLEGGRR